jgi:iron(III) transport system substrate-binding protein
MRKLTAFLLIAFVASAAAQTRQDQARREGEVVWFTSMNAADAEALLRPFRERHPFLEISILRATSDRIRSNILADAADGRFAWDVVSFRMFDIATLSRAGLLADYRSPETQSAFPEGTFDPKGRWATIFMREYVIGYNANMVKAAELPKSWQDLLAPRWTGKIALDDSDVEWYAAMLDYWGREKGIAYMRALAHQKPERLRGHQVLAQQLAAGKFPLALLYVGDIERPRTGGAQLQWLKNLDPTISSPTQIAICAKAPHPAAARLLVDFMLSKEGQQAIRGRSRLPVRTDLAPGVSRPKPLRVHYVDPRLADKASEYEAEFRRTLDRTR